MADFLPLKELFCCPWHFVNRKQTHQRVKKFWWPTCCSFRRNISMSMWTRFSSSVFNRSFYENNKTNLRTSSQQGWKGDVLRIGVVAVTVAQVFFTSWAPKNSSVLLPKRQVSSLPFSSRSHTGQSRAPGAVLDTGKCPELRTTSPLPGKWCQFKEWNNTCRARGCWKHKEIPTARKNCWRAPKPHLGG